MNKYFARSAFTHLWVPMILIVIYALPATFGLEGPADDDPKAFLQSFN